MSTSARMLQLLSLLQTHRFWPGTELSVRLEVSERTLRRDIERLRDLGYDVDATRGVAGGYQLRAGNALPPLLLDDEEAVAIAVGLRTAAAGMIAGMGDTSAQALGKVVALMPPRLRRRMDAVTSQTDSLPWGGRVPLDAGVLGVLAQACRDDEALTFTYRAPEAEPTRRRVEPHRLVNLGNRWYLLAYDRVRQDWRSFRVDRVTDPTTTGQRFRPRDIPGGDAAAYVQKGIRSRAATYDISVFVRVEPDVVAGRVGRWGEVEPAEGGCRMRMQADDLGWPMMILAGIEADFTVEQPAELAEMVQRAGERFVRSGASST
ncbi:putative DNA-binding transcriptional regulator YafY [Nocardioides luteus]|uniref:DeoR family transcriptional regulator n=1 Tax=Nocardioides luteus TaxID=1844 RepID=A0ABQ5SWT3_9ACTN|nr:YafY family protein [Nocardioides luteus]MDR7312388.1 putative DNA-binding transcriptional regulator YafY [Nocardioides luteus]GGR58153.1 DeoR family transcriptional regulator [Nocardioides luteus]GLJ68635.1 DeoR family transcriptional regulator [Nocardioides luteus]